MVNTHSSDEAAIRQLIATWLDATRAGDVDTVLSLMTEDVVFLAPGQPPMHGRDAFAHGLRAILLTHRIVSDSVVEDIEVSGDLAYCRTRLSVRVEPLSGGEPMKRGGHALTVFRRSGGKWQLARDANMLSAKD